MNFTKSRLYQVARKMPPLYHKLPGEEFNLQKSRALWWLMKQSEVRLYIWDRLKQSGAIVYDRETGKWRGADFSGGD